VGERAADAIIKERGDGFVLPIHRQFRWRDRFLFRMASGSAAALLEEINQRLNGIINSTCDRAVRRAKKDCVSHRVAALAIGVEKRP
jgi:glutamate dehydrogenase (NAD(P)+)